MKKNIGLKVSALLLALIMWLFVNLKEQSTIMIDVPIEFRDIPPSLQIADTKTYSVNITLKGHERFLKDITPKAVHIYMDMSIAKEGENHYDIERKAVKIPPLLKLTAINPSSIKVNLIKKRKI